ncbi:MAG TPA: hypothetical protein VJU86_16580 [Pyrinomonadaceae bacterium]|nr:hypothetical protein [Pyrinomonadaceae bacterium]
MLTKLLTVLMLSGLLLSAGCSRTNPGASNTTNSETSSNTTSSPVPAKTGFEADLEYVRKGQYTYVWVFSRKDGKPLDKEDGAYLRTNAPQVVDWVTSEGGKKVIAGTNFDLALGNLELLKKRFVVEDFTGK